MDYRNPNYSEVYALRAEKLKKIRSNPELLEACHLHYKHHPWDFINDWGMTFDPRNIERDLPASVPFILFPKQIELVKWFHEKWKGGEPGLVEKTRDCGATWLAGAYSVAMWRYRDGFAAGFGSRKEELVDKKGDPKTIFEKIRFFINHLPVEFLPKNYQENKHSSFMRIVNPSNNATITGEAGDNIGRGGRQSIYFVDESAFIQRQAAKDAALSQNTNCQIDISTPNGNGNEFYKKRMSSRVDVFVMDWRDDPRKSQAWYDKQVSELDEVIVAQEIDRDYNASQENVFIPAKWVRACIDAHKKLGWEATGAKRLAFDPADVGDARAFAYRHGNVVKSIKQLKCGDVRDAVPWVKLEANKIKGLNLFVTDEDGMGAPIVKLAIADDMEANGIPMKGFRGNGELDDPEEMNEALGKANKDAFRNRRAQFWYKFRERCELTYYAVEKGIYTSPDKMISFDSESIGQENLINFQAEISRPMRKYSGDGKIRVESKEEMKSREVASPNMADSVIMSEELPDIQDDWGELNYPQTMVI